MLNYHKTDFFFQVFKLDILSPACVIFLYFYILSNYNNNKTKYFRAKFLSSTQNPLKIQEFVQKLSEMIF